MEWYLQFQLKYNGIYILYFITYFMNVLYIDIHYNQPLTNLPCYIKIGIFVTVYYCLVK